MEIIGLGDDCRLPAADCIRLVQCLWGVEETNYLKFYLFQVV